MANRHGTSRGKKAAARTPRLRASGLETRKFSSRRANLVFLAGLALAAGVFASGLFRTPSIETAARRILLPAFSDEQQAGSLAFARHCQVCHGENAAGTRAGPPLVHKIYEPSHHGDRAFVRAVRQGVIAHHWRFGDMPRLPDVADQELDAIIGYVRAMQRANGIH